MDAKPATITSTAPESVEEAIVEIRTYVDKCIAYCTATYFRVSIFKALSARSAAKP